MREIINGIFYVRRGKPRMAPDGGDLSVMGDGIPLVSSGAPTDALNG